MSHVDSLQNAAINPRLWLTLSWHEIVQSYRRTTLGPIWITLNMLIFAMAMTGVYSAIFSIPPGEYGAFVVTSMMIWWWIGGVLNEGGMTFLGYGEFIKGVPCEKSVFVWAAASKQVIILAHHAIIYVLLMVIGLVTPTIYTLLVIPCVLVLFLMSVPIIAILSVLFIRFRDLPRLVSSAIVILMMITPVFWKPSMLTGRRALLYEFNPFYYLIEFVRRPLLGEPLTTTIIAVVLSMTVAAWLAGCYFFARYRRYLVFWL